jgi:hypothetical protein
MLPGHQRPDDGAVCPGNHSDDFEVAMWSPVEAGAPAEPTSDTAPLSDLSNDPRREAARRELADALAAVDCDADDRYLRMADALQGRYWRPAAEQAEVIAHGKPVFGVTPGDPFRIEKWNALADDRCMFAGCNATETDPRGPVWLCGDGMGKACTEHWEPIMRVIGEQVSWERTDAHRSGPSQSTPTEPTTEED